MNDAWFGPRCRQIVVWAYNAAKGTGTHEDVVRFARALVAAQRDQAVG